MVWNARIALSVCRVPERPFKESRMTPRAVDETKPNKRADEVFDFPETSGMCDFGYVLAVPVSPAAAQQTATQPAK